jgi:hypothetical protein
LTWIFYSHLATVRLLLELVHGNAEVAAANATAEPAAESTGDDNDEIPF